MAGLRFEFVLDSCTCINFLNKKLLELPQGHYYISVVTRMELLADPKHTDESQKEAADFIETLSVIPLTEAIEHEAIAIRRFGKPRPKLPDAIIAATAKVLNVPLVTLDGDLSNLSFPGLLISGMN